MKKFRVLCLMFISLFAGLLVFNSEVSAKNVLKTVSARDIDANVIGSIIFYDDYTLEYTYKYRVKEVKIWICTNTDCLNGDPLISYGQTYIGGESIVYDLTNYFPQVSESITYYLKAYGDFKVSEIDPFGDKMTLLYEITREGVAKDPESEKIIGEVKKVEEIMNKLVIPFIYMIVSIIFVVKLVMLCMDLVKYSDNAEIRKQKLRGFLFTFLGLFIVLLVNSSVGFITGLFY